MAGRISKASEVWRWWFEQYQNCSIMSLPSDGCGKLWLFERHPGAVEKVIENSASRACVIERLGKRS